MDDEEQCRQAEGPTRATCSVIERARRGRLRRETKPFGVKLQIDTSKCIWIRLCFGEKDNGDLCADPTKSVELLLAHKVFAGINSGEAPLGNH